MSPCSATGPTGARTEATYDDLGRRITSTVIERHPSPGAFTTTYTYDDAGNLRTTKSPTGLTVSATYNAAGDPLTTTDTAGGVTTYGYGPTGLPTSTTTPQGRTTRTVHDLAGRATEVRDENSAGTVLRTMSTAYDPDGNPIAVTDPLGHTVQQTFDALGRLTKLVEPVDADTSITTTYGYDAAGNRTRLTDGCGTTTWYGFTSRGSLESVVEPSTQAHPDAEDRTWTTVYDAVGQPVKELQPGGVTVQRTFDALGRLTRATGSGAEAPTTPDVFGYDAAGRLTSASAPGGTNTYTYDDRGNLLSSDGPSGSASFSYDTEGRLTARTDAAGQATFGYDGAGRLRTAADPLTSTTLTYGYDAASRLTSVAYGGTGATRSLGYDALDRPVSDTLKAPGGTTTASVAYDYDKASRLVEKTTTGTAGAGTQSYGYDRAGRLTSWTADDGTVTDYTWDAAGNRTSAGETTATYDARNRLLTADDVTYTYSARGNRTGSSDASGSHSFAFDAHGRMVSADGTAYGYDALGRLVRQGEATLTYADQSNKPVAAAAALVFRDPSGEALSSAAADGSNATALLVRPGDAASEAKVDKAHDEFVDDSFTKSLKELGFSADEFAEYFEQFPDPGAICVGGLLGLQCTGGGNLLDPDTGVAYCNPGAGWTPGNTCVPLSSARGPADAVDPEDLAAKAKKLADDIHRQITPPFVAEVFRTTAVTVARRADGSLVNVVTGAGKGLSKDQLSYIKSLGRPDIVVAANMDEAHAEETAVHFMALNGLTPVDGGVTRSDARAPGRHQARYRLAYLESDLGTGLPSDFIDSLRLTRGSPWTTSSRYTSRSRVASVPSRPAFAKHCRSWRTCVVRGCRMDKCPYPEPGARLLTRRGAGAEYYAPQGLYRTQGSGVGLLQWRFWRETTPSVPGATTCP